MILFLVVCTLTQVKNDKATSSDIGAVQSKSTSSGKRQIDDFLSEIKSKQEQKSLSGSSNRNINTLDQLLPPSVDITKGSFDVRIISFYISFMRPSFTSDI